MAKIGRRLNFNCHDHTLIEFVSINVLYFYTIGGLKKMGLDLSRHPLSLLYSHLSIPEHKIPNDFLNFSLNFEIYFAKSFGFQQKKIFIETATLLPGNSFGIKQMPYFLAEAMANLITVEDLNSALNSLSREETLELRSQYIPKACKLHFEKSPMKVLRASGQYIYDDSGCEYLDCVNCVAHVGHCNPLVVEAAKTAMLQMGNISVGMSDLASEYVSKLKATFPKEIDTFLFVSSGSEANDIAVQMARLYTGNTDVVSIDRGFHGGGLTLPNCVSPRQYSNEERCPDWVHVLPCPDLYRGKYTEKDRVGEAVEKYCTDARKVINDAVERKRKLACFISEPLITVAGIILPPSRWLHSVYEVIRLNGGLTIADEAQSGLGRCGTSFWCFQMHENLVPDIITIGKPLGNGYPMACIATRCEVAASLTNQSSSVNFQHDYSCDLVSAAVGLAVLNSIRSSSLQLNAKTVGEFLKEGIKSLGMKHQNIGQVRGSGLMVGVEIVYNQESRKPARDIAERICYKMLEHFIIIANEGPQKNILILTPPMCFTCENAHRVILALEKVLSEIEAAPWNDNDIPEPTSPSTGVYTGERLLTLAELTNSAGDGNRNLNDLTESHEIGRERRISLQNGSPSTINSYESFLDDMLEEEDDGGYGTSNSFTSMD